MIWPINLTTLQKRSHNTRGSMSIYFNMGFHRYWTWKKCHTRWHVVGICGFNEKSFLLFKSRFMTFSQNTQRKLTLFSILIEVIFHEVISHGSDLRVSNRHCLFYMCLFQMHLFYIRIFICVYFTFVDFIWERFFIAF